MINILFGLIRVKAAALLLGPTGVGLIGLFQNLLQTAATLGGLGLGSAGTRQIADAHSSDDPAAFPLARRGLLITATVLAIVASTAMFLLRDLLATALFDDPALGGPIGWLSLGVALSLAVAFQTALLTGVRRIGDIARISVFGSIVTTIVAVAALYVWREHALVLFVLATPAASALAGLIYVRRVAQTPGLASPGRRAVAGEIAALLRLGSAFTLAGAALLLGQLALRTLIQRDLGTAALGHFQAAWFISITYIGFVLQAMGTDYYPRLTAAMRDPATANRLVNEQSEVALLLAAPVLLGMLALTPFTIGLLYSSAFTDAVVVLRWQILGDVLKIASWPMGFVLLASGDARTYMATETAAVAVLVGVSALLLPAIGLEGSGVAVFVMYLFYLPLVYRLVRRRTGLRWTAAVTRIFWLLLAACVATFAVARWSELAGAILGCVGAAGFAILALIRLGDALPGPLRRLSERVRR